MCWLRLRNAGYFTVSLFLCLAKVEILGFNIPFLWGFSPVFPFSSVILHKAKAERRSCKPVKPCERLTSFRLHKPQPNISILAMVCHRSTGDKPTFMTCWSICVCPAIAQNCGFSPKSALCLLPAGPTYCPSSPQTPTRAAALRLSALQPQGLNRRAVRPYPVISDVSDQCVLYQKGWEI